MKNLLVYVFLVCFVTTFSQKILAWDDTGHKITAYIAWEQMTPQAREMAIKLFLNAPEESQIIALHPTPPDLEISTYPIGTRSKAAKQREFFMIMAYWADIVRERKYPNRYKFHHSTWHYLNTFWREVNSKVEIVTELKGDQENIVERLFHFDQVLRDSTVKDADKAIALGWVLHLVGDVHQPLHASGRITESEPTGDQGANLFSLSPKDTPRNQQQNLHWYWDSIVARSVARKNDASDTEYLLPIAKTITKKYPFKLMQSRLAIGKFDRWQQESFQIASTGLYPQTLKRGELPSAAYQKMSFKIAEEQLAIAGYRMGEMLNRIFGGTQSASNAQNCLIISKVRYPITQTNPSETQTVEIGLLNLCPPNPGMMARPLYQTMVDGKVISREYEVVRIFKTESEAREYAANNGIKDVSF